MPDEAFIWMGRIKAVEREYGAIRFGTDRLIVAVNPRPLPTRSTAAITEMSWYTSDLCRSLRSPLGRRLGRYAPS